MQNIGISGSEGDTIKVKTKGNWWLDNTYQKESDWLILFVRTSRWSLISGLYNCWIGCGFSLTRRHIKSLNSALETRVWGDIRDRMNTVDQSILWALRCLSRSVKFSSHCITACTGWIRSITGWRVHCRSLIISSTPRDQFLLVCFSLTTDWSKKRCYQWVDFFIQIIGRDTSAAMGAAVSCLVQLFRPDNAWM